MKLDHELFKRLFVLGRDVPGDNTTAQERLCVFADRLSAQTRIKNADLATPQTFRKVLSHTDVFLIVRVVDRVRLERILVRLWIFPNGVSRMLEPLDDGVLAVVDSIGHHGSQRVDYVRTIDQIRSSGASYRRSPLTATSEAKHLRIMLAFAPFAREKVPLIGRIWTMSE
jgi:hypothetical protein